MSDDIVEISKAKLALLEGQSKLNQELWNDPKYGLQIKEMVKDKYPHANIPELDAFKAVKESESQILSKVAEKEKAVDEKIAAFEKTWQERDEKVASEKQEREFASEVEATKKKYQLSAEGMEKVFARMKEKNNPDVEAAAAWVTDHQVAAKPVDSNNFSPQDMNLYGSSHADAEWEAFNRNPIKAGDAVLTEMINDFQNGRQDKYREFGGTL